MVFLLLLLILPLYSSSPLTACSFYPCPRQSTCFVDSQGQPSCLCNDGFAGSSCEIVLCHDFSCLGPLSFCENTMQGPRCHCEQGRTGDNCELLKLETNQWSRCRNATFCEERYQNGKCDEICNTPECLYDGYDCMAAEYYNDDLQEPFVRSLVMVRVEVSPYDFLTSVHHFLSQFSNFLNKTVSIANFDGYDLIYTVDDTKGRILVTEKTAVSLNSSFIEVDLSIDISSCDLSTDDCDRSIEQIHQYIKDGIESKALSSLHITSSSIIHSPPSTSSLSSPSTIIIAALLSLLLLSLLIALVVERRSPKKRQRVVEAYTVQIPTKDDLINCPPHKVVSPLAKRRRSSIRRNVTSDLSNGGTQLHQLAAAHESFPGDRLVADAMNLLNHGVDVNAQDRAGNTALHLAILHSRLGLVQTLLSHPNIDISIANNQEQTALHIAATIGYCPTLGMLLAHRKDKRILHLTDYHNRTPLVLHITSSAANPTLSTNELENTERQQRATEFARKLLEAGTDPDYPGDKTFDDSTHLERTALHFAAQYGLLQHIHLLVEHGANINATDTLRRNPLYYAVDNLKLDAIRLLVSLGANPNTRNHDDETPVDYAKRTGFTEAVEFFEAASQAALLRGKKTKRGASKANNDKKKRRLSTDTGYQSSGSPLADLDEEFDDNNDVIYIAHDQPIHTYPVPPSFPIPPTPQLTPHFPMDSNSYDYVNTNPHYMMNYYPQDVPHYQVEEFFELA